MFTISLAMLILGLIIMKIAKDIDDTKAVKSCKVTDAASCATCKISRRCREYHSSKKS